MQKTLKVRPDVDLGLRLRVWRIADISNQICERLKYRRRNSSRVSEGLCKTTTATLLCSSASSFSTIADMFRRPFSSIEEFDICAKLHGVSYIHSDESSSSSECMDELDENYYMNRPLSIFSNNRPINMTIPTNALFPNTVPPANENVPIDSFFTNQLYSDIREEIPSRSESCLEMDGLNEEEEQQNDDNSENRWEQVQETSSKSKKKKKHRRQEEVAQVAGTSGSNNKYTALPGCSSDESVVEAAQESSDEGEHCSLPIKGKIKKKRNKKRNRKKRAQEKNTATHTAQVNYQTKEVNGNRRNVLKQKVKERLQQQNKPSSCVHKSDRHSDQLEQLDLPQFTIEDLVRTESIVSLMGKSVLDEQFSICEIYRETIEKSLKMSNESRNLAKEFKKITNKMQKRQKFSLHIPILLYEVPTTKSNTTDLSPLCLRRENIYNPYYFDTKLIVCDVVHLQTKLQRIHCYSTNFVHVNLQRSSKEFSANTSKIHRQT